MMRLMGIDYGEKRIGISLSDEKQEFAFPNSVIKNCPDCSLSVVQEVKKISKENSVSRIVLGKSVDYKGEPNPIMKKIESFKNLLEKEIGLPVVYQTETLTTKEAERLPFAGKARSILSNKRKQSTAKQEKGKKNDASAAALILRSFIEKQ